MFCPHFLCRTPPGCIGNGLLGSWVPEPAREPTLQGKIATGRDFEHNRSHCATLLPQGHGGLGLPFLFYLLSGSTITLFNSSVTRTSTEKWRNQQRRKPRTWVPSRKKQQRCWTKFLHLVRDFGECVWNQNWVLVSNTLAKIPVYPIFFLEPCPQKFAMLDVDGLVHLHDVVCLWVWLVERLRRAFPSETVDRYESMFMRGCLGCI